MEEPEIRDAATVVAIRDPAGPRPRVLMGQRGSGAAFMPEKFVFPGGALDPADALARLAAPLPPGCLAAIADEAPGDLGAALAAAAIRELWEETGLAIARPGRWGDPPRTWKPFADAGLQPDASSLRFVFRAITPAGFPRRFDARFFLVDAGALAGDPDDFSRASGELSSLQWIPIDEARAFPMAFITEVVLAGVAAALPSLDPPARVPFIRNDDEEKLFLRLGGRAL